MEMYSFGKKYSASDVLSDLSDENPDILMRFLFFVIEIINYYKQSNYGVVISKCKKQTSFFIPTVLSIQHNSDKQVIKAMFDGIIEVCSAEDCTIKECLNTFQSFGLIKVKLIEDVFENTEYNEVLDIRLSEVKNIYAYINRPTISTQHGVKGESHQSVVFVAADSYNTPNVRMYDFFNLWAHNNFSLTEFEELYYEYLNLLKLSMNIDLTDEYDPISMWLYDASTSIYGEPDENGICKKIGEADQNKLKKKEGKYITINIGNKDYTNEKLDAFIFQLEEMLSLLMILHYGFLKKNG